MARQVLTVLVPITNTEMGGVLIARTRLSALLVAIGVTMCILNERAIISHVDTSSAENLRPLYRLQDSY